MKISKKENIELSSKSKIFKIDNLEQELDTNSLEYEHFVKINGRLITLSPLMFDVLSKFEEPNSIEKVFDMFSGLYQVSETDLINKEIFKFIRVMLSNRILVKSSEKADEEHRNLDFKINDQIENYILEKEIYNNDQVKIFICHKEDLLNTKYLLKIALSKSSEATVLREFHQIRKIGNHENIRKILGLGEHDDIQFLVLEYIEGKRIIDLADNLDLKLKISLCRQLLLVFNHVHNAGVLHGDIHMSNFLVNTDMTLKLIDFGMSVELSESKSSGHGGVPQYMPPERVNNHTIKFSEKHGNIKSEIFQIGLIMYTILYNRLPFSGTLWKDLASSILNDIPFFKAKTLLDEKIPKNLIELISRSLSKNPNDRHESVLDMIHEMNFIKIKD
jgi:serine/threonine protein kinase